MSDWQKRARKKKAPTARTITLTPETQRIVAAQHAAFREKFGRDPGARDPLFFDPESDDVRPLTGDRLRDAMIEAAATIGGIPEIEAAAALDDVTTPNQG